MLHAFEGRIIPFDTAAARKCAELHAPDKRAERDAMIAATAFIHRSLHSSNDSSYEEYREF